MQYRYYDLRQALEEEIHRKRTINNRLSLNAISKQIGMSLTSLTYFLNNKTSINEKSAFRIIKWLKVNDELADYLMTVHQYSLTESESERDVFRTKMKQYFWGKLFLDTEDLNKKISHLEIDQYFLYMKTPKTCSEDDRLASRGLFRLRDKVTKKPSLSFYDTYADMRGLESGGGYFIKNNSDDCYTCYHREKFSHIHSGVITSEKNKNLKVEFDDDGLPNIVNLWSKYVNLDQYGIMNFKFSKKSFIMTGDVYTQTGDQEPQFLKRVQYFYQGLNL